MVVLSIILGVALVFAGIVIYVMWNLMFKYYAKAMENDMEFMMNEYFKNETEKVFPCTLLLAIKEGAEFEGTSYDFSTYEDNNVIGLTKFVKEMSNNGKYTDEEGDPIPTLIPCQKICLMKDGSYQWDFRALS